MRFTQEQVDAHQERIHVERSKHRPRPQTALISQACAAKAKKSKFRNIRCRSSDGIDFASQLERDYYEQLLLRQKAGDVLWFILQPTFLLEGGVKYRGDFLIVRSDGVDIVDTKGVLTQGCKNKLKQVKARYGIDVQLVRRV